MADVFLGSAAAVDDPLSAETPPGAPPSVRAQGMVRQIAGALRSIYPGWLTPRAGARWARAGGAAAAGGFRGPGAGTSPGRGGHRQGAGGAAVVGDDRRRSGGREDGPGTALSGRGRG